MTSVSDTGKVGGCGSARDRLASRSSRFRARAALAPSFSGLWGKVGSAVGAFRGWSIASFKFFRVFLPPTWPERRRARAHRAEQGSNMNFRIAPTHGRHAYVSCRAPNARGAHALCAAEITKRTKKYARTCSSSAKPRRRNGSGETNERKDDGNVKSRS